MIPEATLGALAALVYDVVRDGGARLNWSFITNLASRNAAEAGVYHALMGTIWVIALTAAMALPVGVAAAIYLEEYAARSWVARFIELNIANLAAVPSIIYGLLGLGLSLSWGLLRQINLAHFALAFLAAYLCWQLSA